MLDHYNGNRGGFQQPAPMRTAGGAAVPSVKDQLPPIAKVDEDRTFVVCVDLKRVGPRFKPNLAHSQGRKLFLWGLRIGGIVSPYQVKGKMRLGFRIASPFLEPAMEESEKPFLIDIFKSRGRQLINQDFHTIFGYPWIWLRTGV